MSTWDDETTSGAGTGSATATGGRHPVDVGHLVMGLVFGGMVLVWALVTQDLVDGDDLRWLLPLPWVLAGGAGLVATALGTRRRSRTGTGRED